MQRLPRDTPLRPHACGDCTQNSLRKTPKYLKKRLLSEQSNDAVHLHERGIFSPSAVNAWSPGRLPEEVFTLLISGRERQAGELRLEGRGFHCTPFYLQGCKPIQQEQQQNPKDP